MTETQKIQKLILYIANEVIRICDKIDIPYNNYGRYFAWSCSS